MGDKARKTRLGGKRSQQRLEVAKSEASRAKRLLWKSQPMNCLQGRRTKMTMIEAIWICHAQRSLGQHGDELFSMKLIELKVAPTALRRPPLHCGPTVGGASLAL